MKNKAPNIDPKKFLEIPNGYDPNDFSSTKRKIKNESYTMVYTGTLTLDYPIQLLYESLRKIIEKPGDKKMKKSGWTTQQKKSNN